jgi:hypothetical protein
MSALGLVLVFSLAQSDSDLLQMLGGGGTDEASLQQMVSATLPKVAKVMGVATPRKVPVKVIDREQASQKIQEVLKREYPGDRLERLGQALKLVHVVDPALDVARTARDAYAKNVSGFYDPHDRVLYLLKDQPAIAQEMIIPHELAHALQDEKLSLDQATRDRMESEDAQLAMSAAVEGNAQAVAAQVMTLGLEGDESGLKELLNEAASASATLAMGQDNVSPWLALQISFPYSGGASLVKAVATREDPTGLKLLARLPQSTAQVISPELYRKNEKPLSGRIGLAALFEGAPVVYETVVGRANIDLLGDGLGEGWRGDRLEVVRAGGVACGAWALRFTTPLQAERFATAYSARIGAAAGTRSKNSDKTVSSVAFKESTVVVVEHAPEAKADAIEAAARKALH